MRIIFDNEKELRIEPYDDEFSIQWYNEVLRVRDSLDEKDRIYNLNNRWSKDYCNKMMIEYLDIISTYDPTINPKGLSDTELSREYNIDDQESLNYLHHYFENMIGIDKLTQYKKSDYFEAAPENVQRAIRDFNVLIHRIEGINAGKRQRIVCTFKEKKRYKLPEYLYERFNFRQTPGTVCLNYCQTGKPPYDAYKDKDDHVSAENIVHQQMWAPDFCIQFFPGIEFDPNFEDMRRNAMLWAVENNVTQKGWGRISVGQCVDYNLDDLFGVEYMDRIEP